MEYGIATRQNATRSIDTRILGRDPVDPAVGHDFWAQRSGTGRTDKQSGYLVEFECVLRDVLRFYDMGFSGVPSRAALHKWLRCRRKLRAMPYPLRLQSRGGDRVREDAAV
jgi:hypothetical protein